MQKIPVTILGILLLVWGFALAGPQAPATIAVAAADKIPGARVSNLAGRSPFFLLFDGQGNFQEAIENPYRAQRSGAGVSLARFLASKGVRAVVAENFGSKMITALNQNGLVYFPFKGLAKDGVNQLLEANIVSQKNK